MQSVLIMIVLYFHTQNNNNLLIGNHGKHANAKLAIPSRSSKSSAESSDSESADFGRSVATSPNMKQGEKKGLNMQNMQKLV